MRTLRRPMFRMGGSANQGITSGLEKPKRGLVDEPGKYSQKLEDMSLSNIRDYSIGDIRKISQSFRPKETYRDRDDFLVNLGLDLVSRPPSSNIVSTVGAAAKGPFQQLQASKAQKTQSQQQSEADLFGSLIGAQAKVLGSEGGSKLFSKEQAANAVARLMGEWQDLRDRKSELSEEEFEDQKAIIFGQIQQYQKENPAIASLFNDKDFTTSVKSKIKRQLQSSQKIIKVPNPEGEGTIEMTEAQYYNDDRNAFELQEEIGKKYLEYYRNMTMYGVGAVREGGKEGGRMGYQQGMSVMPAAGDMGQETGNMQQETMPEELQQNLTFEELRNRLPQEVTDDIINLILSSAEAMEDFAIIQTEQDISNFNKKYGVNLVLPSEG